MCKAVSPACTWQQRRHYTHKQENRNTGIFNTKPTEMWDKNTLDFFQSPSRRQRGAPGSRLRDYTVRTHADTRRLPAANTHERNNENEWGKINTKLKKIQKTDVMLTLFLLSGREPPNSRTLELWAWPFWQAKWRAEFPAWDTWHDDIISLAVYYYYYYTPRVTCCECDLVFSVNVCSGLHQQFDRLTEAVPRSLV